MSNEFNEKFENYISDLNTAIEKAQKEREKIAASDSKRKEKKLAKIDKIIDQLSELGSRANKLEDTKNDLLNLEKLDLGNDSEIIVTITNVIENLNAEQNEEFKDLKDKLGYTDSEILDVDEFKKELEKQNHDLNRKMRFLSGKEYERAEEQLNKIDYLIIAVNEYSDSRERNAAITSALEDVKKFETVEKKKECLNKAISAMTEKYDDLEDQVLEDMESLPKIQKKIKVKEEKEEKDNWFKSHWKGLTATIVGVAVAAGLTATIIYLANKIEKLSNDDKDRTPSTSDTTNPGETTPSNPEEDKQVNELQEKNVKALTEKGYNEAKAKLMAVNFDQATIDNLIDAYNPEVEKYANCKEFNLSYLEDYDYVINTYALTSLKTVDYVNRSYKIAETNFYEGASIDDIVKVVMSIDNKDLYKYENGALAQSFNTTFSPMVDRFLFGTVSDEDINKMDALQYFAKDGSDMDNFLTTYGALAKKVLSNPQSKEDKDKLFNFVSIFALSFGGYSNEDLEKVITTDEKFNQDAMVIDYVDWFVAYNSFIAPLYPINAPITPEEPKKPEIPANATEEEIAKINAEYELALAEFKVATLDYDAQFSKIAEIQDIIISALQGPEMANICGQSLEK